MKKKLFFSIIIAVGILIISMKILEIKTNELMDTQYQNYSVNNKLTTSESKSEIISITKLLNLQDKNNLSTPKFIHLNLKNIGYSKLEANVNKNIILNLINIHQTQINILLLSIIATYIFIISSILFFFHLKKATKFEISIHGALMFVIPFLIPGYLLAILLKKQKKIKASLT